MTAIRRLAAVLTASAVGLTLSAAPATAETTDLLIGANVRVDGASAQDGAGNSIAPAGDVNGDGFEDMVIGARDATVNGRTQAGAAYVVFGTKRPGPTIDLNAMGTRGFRIAGAAAGNRAGSAVAHAGDINDDGFDDVVVSANLASNPGRPESGRVYVVFGGPNPGDVDLAALGTRGFTILGEAGFDRLGSAVAGAGDVNGDGREDVAIGAVDAGAGGITYVVFGSATPGTVDLAALGAGGYRIVGAVAGDASGCAVVGAGDLNADGRDDLLIGARDAKFNGRDFSGSTYVVYGIGSPTTVQLAALGGTGYRIDGAGFAHNSGSSLGIGDINDDDRTDILIGAPNADYNGRNDSGSAYAVFGTASPGPVDLAALGTAGIRIDGQAANDLSGASVAALDINGDSVDDLVSGAPSADNNGRAQSGSVYVVYGGVQVGNRDLAAPDRRFDGAAADDRTGRSVAAIGDLDGDAGEDVAIGAPFAGNNGRFGAGSAYVVFGEPFEVEPAPITTPQPSATLTVKARKATKKVRRTGRAVLVRKVTVGPGQKYRTTVRVKPKRTRAKTVIRKKKGRVLVRTVRAGRGRITVRIKATGPGVTPTTWSRSWRVR